VGKGKGGRAPVALHHERESRIEDHQIELALTRRKQLERRLPRDLCEKAQVLPRHFDLNARGELIAADVLVEDSWIDLECGRGRVKMPILAEHVRNGFLFSVADELD